MSLSNRRPVHADRVLHFGIFAGCRFDNFPDACWWVHALTLKGLSVTYDIYVDHNLDLSYLVVWRIV